MEALTVAYASIFSPIVLSFVLGAIAAWARSDLKLPESAQAALSIYLLFAIGLKGGIEVARTPLAELVWPACAALMLGLAIPVWSYGLLRGAGFATIDAAAIAAHYGSVSAVTFFASLAYLDRNGVAYEGFAPALLALMEIPAIVVALILARGLKGGAWRRAFPEIVSGKSVVLLTGGLVIGWVCGPEGFAPVKSFFTDMFRGALCLFLLTLGVTAAECAREFRKVGVALTAFALLMPPFNALVGTAVGASIGLSVGGTMVLATLAASASYIAAPAAVRLALPEANPGYYLTTSVAITFPFNLVVGLPLYHAMAVATMG